MAETGRPNPAAALGERLTDYKNTQFKNSFRKLEREVFKLLGDYAPSYETLRRYHKGEIGPEEVDMVVICALAEIYGCRLSDLSDRLVERWEATRDLLIRQSCCIVDLGEAA